MYLKQIHKLQMLLKKLFENKRFSVSNLIGYKSSNWSYLSGSNVVGSCPQTSVS